MNFTQETSESMTQIKTDEGVIIQFEFDYQEIYIDGNDFGMSDDTLNGIYFRVGGLFYSASALIKKAEYKDGDLRMQNQLIEANEIEALREIESDYRGSVL